MKPLSIEKAFVRPAHEESEVVENFAFLGIRSAKINEPLDPMSHRILKGFYIVVGRRGYRNKNFKVEDFCVKF